MWVAKDECGRLGFYELKPERTDYGVWDYLGGGYTEVPQDCYLFPNLKWEDEPIEVELVELIKKCKENKKEELIMWIARDENNTLKLFTEEPELDLGKYWIADGKGYVLPTELYPNLTSKDEPIEVEIVSKKFMDMWRVQNAVMTKMFEQEEEGMIDIPSEVVDAVDKDLFNLTID